jgi:Ras-related protein Rab-21
MSSGNRYKVVLLGEGRVGKTSILLRYTRGEYNDKQVSTLQASYLDKTASVNGDEVVLSIWDTAGQERFHALGPIYYRDADGALLVYDITDQSSFEKVRTWIKELRKIVGSNIHIIIAGNKCDLEKHRSVNALEAQKFADSVGAVHVLTSAKTDKNLDDVFTKLATKMVKSRATKKGGMGGGAGGERSTSNRLVIVDEPPPPVNKKGCC